MSTLARQTYIISDLHLGGVYPPAGSTNDRGFRICTHAADVSKFIDLLTAKPAGEPPIELIINGDLVDFLAEKNDDGNGWSPFTRDQQLARKKLEAIIARDQVVFDALARFVAKGHRLVVLLGNHDIELALPALRTTLAKALGVTKGSDYELIRDGEAYVVGDALIEHGNRYDDFNIVNYETLMRHCQYVTRGEQQQLQCFDPPPGSMMVTDVINPIKEQYKFIDLLKPETGAVVPLLLTLEPGYRSILGKVALIAAKRSGAVKVNAAPQSGGGFEDMAMSSDISSDTGVLTEEAALAALLTERLKDDVHDVTSALEHTVDGTAGASDISSIGDLIDHTFGMARLLFSSSTDNRASRIDALAAAFRSLQGDDSFDESKEAAPEYLDAAKGLAANGIKHVVFGHTHMPKKIALPSGGYYLNSGTWADVMQFPQELIQGEKEQVREKLAAFVEQIVKGDFSTFALFKPTYVRIDLDADGVASPELCRFDPAATSLA